MLRPYYRETIVNFCLCCRANFLSSSVACEKLGLKLVAPAALRPLHIAVLFFPRVTEFV